MGFRVVRMAIVPSLIVLVTVVLRNADSRFQVVRA